MKINLPNRKIRETKRADIQDIPLAYINASDINCVPNITLMPDFTENKKQRLFAYQNIEDPDMLFFDENGNAKKNIGIRKYGNRYLYEPENMTEFTPLTFKTAALIKRRMKYSTAKNYNINISVVEKDDNLSLSEKLIAIFGDANRRGIAPANVTVNNGSTMKESLINNSIAASDFIFVESKDGVDLSGLDIDKTIKKHTNIWISAENFGDMLIDTPNTSTSFEEGKINDFYVKSERKSKPARIFNSNRTMSSYPSNNYKYWLPYEDVLILDSNNEATIIVTPSEFIDNLADNSKIVYDVLLYIFLNAYAESAWASLWITDKPVDYMAYTKTKLNTCHESVNINDLLKNDNYDLGNEYQLLDILIDTDSVKFINIGEDGSMYFKKKKLPNMDPQKSDDQISCLTTKGTVAICGTEEIYEIEDPISISSQSENGVVVITVAPFKSSKRYLNLTSSKSIQIPTDNSIYAICAYSLDGTRETFIKAVLNDKYSLANDGYRLATVSVDISTNANAYDIRVAGGGIPINDTPNYNMADIGNINGRSYRKGSTLIIKLPKKCKPYEEHILKAIKQHISAGEYPVIIYTTKGTEE